MPDHSAAGRRLVAVRLPPGADFVSAVQRCWDRGDAVLPLDPRLPDEPTSRLLDELRPAQVLDADGAHHRGDHAGVDPDVAVVIATAGSQGRPKGVELTHSALAASADATAARLGLGPADHWLCCLPVAHIAGFQIVARSLRAGSEPVLQPSFTIDAVADVAASGAASVVSLVPTMLARLLAADVDLSGFAHVLLGGAPAPTPLLERAREAGARLTITYGMTESSGGCVYDGLPLDGVEVTLDDDRMLLRGPVLFRRYRGRPKLTAEVMSNGWFRTSDLGRLNPEGRLEVLGRADEVILTRGHKVVPDEVAACLLTHPAVADAAVLPRPDPELGAEVAAVIVPRDPAGPFDIAALRSHLEERLAAYAVPRLVLVVPRLPELPTGKPDRSALQRWISEGTAGEVAAEDPRS